MYDAIVAGGGPAGTAAALALVRAGRSVLVADSGGGPPPVGEALPAAARALLRDLGAGGTVPGDGHLPCHTTLSAWGSPALAAVDSIRDPHGHGWHLDRARFDRELLRCARSYGAETATGCTVRPVWRHADGTWTAVLRRGRGRERAVRGRWLVDATGRRAAIATACGARRDVLDRLIAVHLTLGPADPAPTPVSSSTSSSASTETATLVEAAPDGWWYTAPLPDRHRLLVWYTDADLPGTPPSCPMQEFTARLARTRHIAARTTAHRLPPERSPRRAPAHTARLDPVHGPGWLATGDAALAFDPLSSQGILTALFTGMRAGEAVHAQLSGDTAALTRYTEAVDAVHAAYLRNRRDFYGLERRWADEPFWRRRQSVTPARQTTCGLPHRP